MSKILLHIALSPFYLVLIVGFITVWIITIKFIYEIILDIIEIFKK
jgi:hypothetical protein